MTRPDESVCDLTSLSGERGLAVFFMRTAGCPVCLRHARRLAGLRTELAALGVEPAVVVPGDSGAAASTERTIRGITVAAGGGADAHQAVGLDRVLLQQSATLLIDRDGVIRYVRSAYLPTGSFSADGLRRAARELAARR